MTPDPLKLLDKDWMRGVGSISRLVVSRGDGFDGKMCCLGILGVDCGIPKAVLTNLSYPSSVDADLDDKGKADIIRRYREPWEGYMSEDLADTIREQFPYVAEMFNLEESKIENFTAEINDTTFLNDEERVKVLNVVFKHTIGREVEFVPEVVPAGV